MAKKPSLGRQKIKMAKIEIKNHLQVTFSKRRSGLFKKASELCTLCGVEIAIVVFSPAGKVFSFGHPNVESIIGRYITRNPHQNPNNSLNLVESHRGAALRDLNFQLTQVVNEVETERKRGELLDNMRQVSQSQFWWEAPVEKLGFNELEQLSNSMEELKKNVSNQANKTVRENGSTCNNLASFGGDEFRVFDQFESKPDLVNRALANNPNVHSFGYGHGFF